MRSKTNRSSKKHIETSNPNFLPQEPNYYEADRLDCLLKSIEREIEFAKLSNRVLPEKLWLKQQFAIGVNEVTRVLEHMQPVQGMEEGSSPSINPKSTKGSSIQLQAIILASDCNPRWLTKHLPGLALSRKVPLIFIKDNKGGSLRLGQLVKLKTAIAIGVKVKGNAVNGAIDEILQGSIPNVESTTSI